MSGSPRILVYAELLSNIRQVSVGCSLPSPSSHTTKASVSSDRTSLTVRHENEDRLVQLPGKVVALTSLPIPTQSSKNLSWRLPLASPQSSFPASTEAQTIPWSAHDLEPESSVICRACQAMIIPEGTINVWKDLPSENWAEMMEFWHCHKPDDHDHDHDRADGLTSRGYGANSRISAQAGVGFIDLTSFLFLETDCSSLVRTAEVQNDSHGKVQHMSKEEHSLPIYCGKCGGELGVIHGETSSVTLFKWQLAIERQIQSIPQPQPSLANCVSSMLMATLSRSGCSKSILVPMKAIGSSTSLLHIWLLNGNIIFSSTESAQSSVSAVKVLYRMVDRVEADKLTESITSDVQEITLPEIAIQGVADLLGRSNSFLPDNDRRFKEWTVGLLEKWKGKAA